MAYEKHNYASGDVLLASELNEMDDAIKTHDTDISDLKSALREVDAGSVIQMPNEVKIYAFNPSTGISSTNAKRLTYLGGFSLRGAKTIDVIISNGYKWNVYFANTLGSYSLVKQYSNVWIGTSKYFIPVPDNADRVYIACVKSDGSDFTEVEKLSVFDIKLRGCTEKEIYIYDYDTDFYTDYYGTNQYVNGELQPNQYARLTQERFYEIADEKLLRFVPNDGYKAAINFFDANFYGLGNTGSWITNESSIDIANLYPTAKYFKITIVRTDNTVMSASDFNKFSIKHYWIKNIIPQISKTRLKPIRTYSFNSGDFSIYGDTIVFSRGVGTLLINDTEVAASVGHANNMMFGKELYNSYPKLYCGCWYPHDNNCIFVNAITEDSATLLDTITFADLPYGYLNMCVDEPNKRFYIFEETGSDTYQGNILFAVGNFEGNILSSKILDISIPIIQGMDFVDGFCYVTSGNGTATYPNLLMVFDTSGNLVAKSYLDVHTEIEGISVTDDGHVYMKTLKAIFEVE